ncbi:Eco57I restriction-modification methylase domain-containing protein [Xenorhabdus bovienii]|uniref:Eco57I restriction-modification methylase domain-containing protein n=1 Tax=Xenorhabdus bovienii TaxID=40576 RepID=UPI003DA26C17
MKFKSEQTSQKLRGGYYTPQNLADYVTKWVLNKKPESVLEPSCGDGVFIQSLNNNGCNKSINITCFELFDVEAKKALQRCEALGLKSANVTEGDFLVWANKQIKENNKLFDGVLGNPPFIRYQFLKKNFQVQAELVFKQLDQKFTKHTNAWVPFLLAALALLKDGGRMGMVIPSEVIHIMYAKSLRNFMEKICSKIVIIDPKEIWFEDTLQGTVIIFAEKKQNRNQVSEGVAIISVNGFDFLQEDPDVLFSKTAGISGETIKEKWTKAILEPNELSLINSLISHESVYQFNEIAKINVGIITGANHFFLVNNEVIEQYELSDYSYPMLGRSQYCSGILYDTTQHKKNQTQGLPTNFLYIEDEPNSLSSEVKDYIKLGESENYHERYKCKIRKPWYKVPSIYSTEIGMFKRSHKAPKLILNQIGAYTTDTAYRVTSTFTSTENLVCSFLNPLTAITAELEGRYYGGGVLELVPSEIKKLYVPIIEGIEHNLAEINQKVEQGEIDKVMRRQGELILTKLGISTKENDKLMSIWQKLRDRRLRK